MQTELTNLLPSERKQRLQKDYIYRLITVIAVAIALLGVVNIALLAPTYLYLQDQADRYTAKASTLSMARSAAGYESLASRITALNTSATRILSLSNVHAGSDLIRAVLDVPRRGITLTSLTLSPATEGTKITLTGSATTRESLRGFDTALHTMKTVRSTDLPLSAYAKESDIPFTIVVLTSDAP